MNNDNRQPAFIQTGFSLVEIMVGLVIGLLAALVIMQVFSVFESQKRSTTGTANAQTNGSIALYTIQRDLLMAGYGLLPIGVTGVADSAIDCTALTIEAATGIGDISPVTITDGGVAGASDIITVRYSSSDKGGIPVTIRGVATNDMSVDSNLNCQYPATPLTPENAIIINGNSCFMTAVTALSAPTALPPATITLRDPTGAIVGASLACLGRWNEIVYRVNNGSLERNGAPTVADIVNIQAQYGIGNPAAANPNRIVQWVNATGAWAAPTPANRNLIKAVRVAVVARNGSYEKTRPDGTDVTVSYAGKACSSLTTDAPTGVCAWSGTSSGTIPPSDAPAIDLSNDPDWQHYRYRVFETIIPMRNVIWSRSTL